MQVDLSTRFFDYKGKPIMSGDRQTTMRDVICEALVNVVKPDDSADWKLRAWSIASGLWQEKSSTVGLSVEDVAAIKERIGLAFGPAIVGQAFSAIDGPGK